MTSDLDPHLAIFQFIIDQPVMVKPLGIPGIVVGRCEKAGERRTYEVIWWCDGKRNDEWLMESELTAGSG